MRLVERASAVVRWCGEKLRPMLPGFRDMHIYPGALAVGVGGWMAWEPLGPLLAGAILLYIGLWHGARARKGGA